jgi:hypothetical protein
MKIDLVHMRPSDELDKRNVSLSKIAGVSTVAIILGERLDADLLEGLSSAVLGRNVRLVSIYGEQSESLHDLVDSEALRWREPDRSGVAGENIRAERGEAARPRCIVGLCVRTHNHRLAAHRSSVTA